MFGNSAEVCMWVALRILWRIFLRKSWRNCSHLSAAWIGTWIGIEWKHWLKMDSNWHQLALEIQSLLKTIPWELLLDCDKDWDCFRLRWDWVHRPAPRSLHQQVQGFRLRPVQECIRSTRGNDRHEWLPTGRWGCSQVERLTWPGQWSNVLLMWFLHDWENWTTWGKELKVGIVREPRWVGDGQMLRTAWGLHSDQYRFGQ